MRIIPSLRKLALAALFVSPCIGEAALVINNITPSTQNFAASLSGPTAEIFFSPFEDRQFAFSFTTGPDTVTVTDFTFSISLGDVILSPIQITLSTGTVVPGGTGGITLGTVAPLSPTPVGQLLTVTPTSTVTLTPSTNYWIHLTVPSGGGIYSVNNSNNPILAPGWSLGNSWYYEPDFGGSWTEITSGPKARVNLNVESVPEPTTVVLGAVSGLLLCTRRRRFTA